MNFNKVARTLCADILCIYYHSPVYENSPIKLRNKRIHLLEERLLTLKVFIQQKKTRRLEQTDCIAYTTTNRPLARWFSIVDILAFSSPAFSIALFSGASLYM